MNYDLLGLVFQAGPIVQLVLLILVGFSLVSLTLIVSKWLELRSALRDSEAFLEVYRRDGYHESYDAARHLERSPLCVVFLQLGQELARTRDARANGGSAEAGRVRLERTISWASGAEVRRLERGMPLLATTGSATPFIGLFGTVVGIIAAFQAIGEAGQASLAVVGPGIAEALVATAVGLFAAIPATIAYNVFGGRIDAVLAMLERFCDQLTEDLPRLLGGAPETAVSTPLPSREARASGRRA